MFGTDSAIIVAFVFGASILKLTSKILFYASANTNFVFFASSWSQRRVSMNYSQPTQAPMITLFHLSALSHLSREIHSGRCSFIYLHLTAAKAAAKTVNENIRNYEQGHPYTASLYLDSPSTAIPHQTRNKNRVLI